MSCCVAIDIIFYDNYLTVYECGTIYTSYLETIAFNFVMIVSLFVMVTIFFSNPLTVSFFIRYMSYPDL